VNYKKYPAGFRIAKTSRRYLTKLGDLFLAADYACVWNGFRNNGGSALKCMQFFFYRFV
jgi:hypothetical protein